MKLIYTNENRFLVLNAKNLLEHSGVESVVKNEFALGGLGELAPVDVWVELWVNEDDYQKGNQILMDCFGKKEKHEWKCAFCHEVNDASFEVCWNCQSVAS